MYFLLKKYGLIIHLIFCCILFTSCANKVKASKTNSEFKTLPEIQQPAKKDSSLSRRFAEVRKKTEFLDDKTEIILSRHKKWVVLGLIIFLGISFQSLIFYRKD